jgi:ABC-type nickel/cobalt efflux system permease component RcnA
MLDTLDHTTSILLGTTATVAVVHTLLGIDHSLPFVALSRARRWTLTRTVVITALCGAGHVASSVLIGGVGVFLGTTLDSMLWIESARGELAAALLIGFGLTYAAWALWRTWRGVTHTHLHAHADGTVHEHPHQHVGEHAHPHLEGRSLTPWVLFVIFVLGPCEPLIPLMVVPAMTGSWASVGAVVGVFGLLTIGTMVTTVAVGYRGLGILDRFTIGRHADLVAGLIIAASGAAVLALGI